MDLHAYRRTDEFVSPLASDLPDSANLSLSNTCASAPVRAKDEEREIPRIGQTQCFELRAWFVFVSGVGRFSSTTAGVGLGTQRIFSLLVQIVVEWRLPKDW